MDINSENEKFKVYGEFKIFDCIVNITKKYIKVSAPCQTLALKCAKYLYQEGFVNGDERIEFENIKN